MWKLTFPPRRRSYQILTDMKHWNVSCIGEWSTCFVSYEKRDADALMFASFHRWENTTPHPSKNNPPWRARVATVALESNKMGISFSSANSLCLRLLWPSMFAKGPKQLRRATRRDPAKSRSVKQVFEASARRKVTFLTNEARAFNINASLFIICELL